MANRQFPCNKLYQFHIMPVQLNVKIPIGASGAVGSIVGAGVASVTKLATGLYAIQLQDNYSALYNIRSSIISPTTGSAIADGSLVVGTAYRITTVGTTTWGSYGLNPSLTPAVGMSFVATSVGGSGTGTATAIGISGVTSVELMDNGAELSPSAAPLLGGIINIQTLGDTSSSVTTKIPVSPANGSTICIDMYLSNSSVAG